MERTQELFEKIEEYLYERLPQDKLIAFEKELTADNELKIEVEKHRELHQILSDKDTLDFRKKLQKIREEMKLEEAQENAVGFRFSSYWKIAASFALILGLGTLLWLNTKSEQPNELYLSYYEPYPIEDVTRGEVKDKSNEFLKNYSAGKYNEAIIELQKQPLESIDERLRLYLGNSYLSIGEEQEAIKQFIQVIDSEKYYEHANWYLALTYLKIGDIKTSISILEKIIDYNGIHKSKSEELINKIGKNNTL